MKVTICTNTETLRPIWGDIYDVAGFTDSHDWDEAIATAWVKTVTTGLDVRGIDYEYRSDFPYWHGGPGRGTWHADEDSEDVAALVAIADAQARDWAKEDLAEMQTNDEE